MTTEQPDQPQADDPTVVYDRWGVTVYEGDCLDVLRTMPDAAVHAVVTDPPYGLEFMGKQWDRPWAMGKVSDLGVADGTPYRRHSGTPTWSGSGNPVCRHCGGTKYDRTRPNGCKCGQPDFPNEATAQMRAFQRWCEQWAAECLRVLKPGGYLLAFGGTRTYHRLACGIEDAGFEVRDSITWLYGSGFPKSLDVGKAIDKSQRRDFVLAAIELGLSIPGNNLHDWTKAEHSPGDVWWERFKAHLSPDDWSRIERAVVGQRTTGIGTGHGADAYIRDGENRDITAPATDAAHRWAGWGTALKPSHEPIIVARKPLSGTVASNVLEHGTGALNIVACRVSAGQDYREKCASVVGLGSNRHGDVYGEWTGVRVDSAHAAGRWPSNTVLTHLPKLDPVTGEVIGDGCADGCVDGCAVLELDAQSGTLVSGWTNRDTAPSVGAVYGNDARNRTGPHHGDSGGASRFFAQFRWESKAPTAERPRVNGKAHPTVKPVSLMRWLTRLVCPPGGTVLDCFAGTGTTGQAARAEGFPCILIENDPESIPYIKARLDAHPKTEATAAPAPVDEGPVDLFGLLDDEAS